MHILIALRFCIGIWTGYCDGPCLQFEWEPLRHSHHAVYGQVVLGILGQLISPPCLGTALNTYTMQVGAILCAVTLGINIAYVMIERSLPKEARIVTGLQVARRAHRQAGFEEKINSQYLRDDGAKPLTPFSKDHFKFVAISIKAIPAAFCRSNGREESSRVRNRL
jgi:hypothetical protein